MDARLFRFLCGAGARVGATDIKRGVGMLSGVSGILCLVDTVWIPVVWWWFVLLPGAGVVLCGNCIVDVSIFIFFFARWLPGLSGSGCCLVEVILECPHVCVGVFCVLALFFLFVLCSGFLGRMVDALAC